MTSPFDWKTNREPSEFSKSKDFNSIARSKLAKRPKTENGLVDPKQETPCPSGFSLALNLRSKNKI